MVGWHIKSLHYSLNLRLPQEAEVVALPRIIVKRWPGAGVDVLVNNAGLGRNNAGLWDGSTASWVELISTNVLGVCMCTREAIQVRFFALHLSGTERLSWRIQAVNGQQSRCSRAHAADPASRGLGVKYLTGHGAAGAVRPHHQHQLNERAPRAGWRLRRCFLLCHQVRASGADGRPTARGTVAH